MLTAKLETSFKLQEPASIGIDHHGGLIREMLPGELVDVSFVASIKNGTDPLKLTVIQPEPQQGCGQSRIVSNTEVSFPITVPPGQIPLGAVHPGVVTPPRILQKADPDYPVEAQNSGLAGSVVIRAVVGADGTVHDPQVERSLGPGFDEKALEAVKEWKFQPATKNGHNVEVPIEIEVNFKPR